MPSLVWRNDKFFEKGNVYGHIRILISLFFCLLSLLLQCCHLIGLLLLHCCSTLKVLPVSSYEYNVLARPCNVVLYLRRTIQKIFGFSSTFVLPELRFSINAHSQSTTTQMPCGKTPAATFEGNLTSYL
jgi:hypothetical protein